jgi:predicted transposase YdaD
LPGEMKLQFNRRLLAYEEEKRMPYITSIEQDSRETGRQEGRQEGLQAGRQEGRQEGREAALREAVLDLLMVRFSGASLDEIRLKLASVHGEEMLRGLLRKVLESRSPQEFLSQLPS